MDAVYYSRVSTEEESQKNALVTQQEECIKCIQQNSWRLVDAYVDEGKSGTTTNKRDEYKRLVNDLSTNKFDVVVIKSQDRLMRSAKEWYFFLDTLVKNGKKLFFYLENRFYTPDDALITGIKAILAEEYSRELSKKINNSHRNRQTKENGAVNITSKTWGYIKNPDKSIQVDEKEAEIIELIFDLAIQGYGARTISQEMVKRGYTTRNGTTIAAGTIRKMIRNPIYIGTHIANKRHFNFDTKATVWNPESEWIYRENAVPPIVSKEKWEEANRQMDIRKQSVWSDDNTPVRRGKNKGSYALSGKIICGECGSTYWRKYRRKYSNKEEIIVDWSCSEYIQHGRKTYTNKRNKKNIPDTGRGCDCRHIKEADLYNIIYEVAEKNIKVNIKSIISEMKEAFMSISNIKKRDNLKKRLDAESSKITNQRSLLLDKLLEGVISDADYKTRINILDSQVRNISEQREELKRSEEASLTFEDRLRRFEEKFTGEHERETIINKMLEHIASIHMFVDRLEIKLDFCEKIVIELPTKLISM